MKLGMYIMATSTHLNGVLHRSHLSVCLYMYPFIIARQRIDKNFNRARNIDATIEELLHSSFSIRSVSYQRKIGD
jgi:hypothetical protein